jgi:hypothetical protein
VSFDRLVLQIDKQRGRRITCQQQRRARLSDEQIVGVMADGMHKQMECIRSLFVS